MGLFEPYLYRDTLFKRRAKLIAITIKPRKLLHKNNLDVTIILEDMAGTLNNPSIISGAKFNIDLDSEYLAIYEYHSRIN